jgi:ABC-type oligopeptide transport system ATPase subunit
MTAIRIEDLTRIYETSTDVIRRKKKGIVALDGVSLTVEEGESFGLLGSMGQVRRHSRKF